MTNNNTQSSFGVLASQAIASGHLLRLEAIQLISDKYLLGIAQSHQNCPDAFSGSKVERIVLAELRRRNLALFRPYPKGSMPVAGDVVPGEAAYQRKGAP